MNDKIHIGTSGWSYSDWKPSFYPPKLPSGQFLNFYAQTFNITEVNSSFYRLPTESMVQGWATKVPEHFKFCVKMSRYLTHTKRLENPEEPLDRFFQAFEPIKNKLGPVLVQLPPSLKFDYELADYFFEELRKNYRFYDFALEARHHSWLEDESIQLLSKHDISFVISQSGRSFPYAEMLTSKNVYVRMHGPDKLYDSIYSEEMLQELAQKIMEWQREDHIIWVFFNNTMNGYGRVNAIRLKEILGELLGKV